MFKDNAAINESFVDIRVENNIRRTVTAYYFVVYGENCNFAVRDNLKSIMLMSNCCGMLPSHSSLQHSHTGFIVGFDTCPFFR